MAWYTVASSWYPSLRTGPTCKWRLIFAGTRTRTGPSAPSRGRSYSSSSSGSVTPQTLPGSAERPGRYGGDVGEPLDGQRFAAGTRVDAGGTQQPLGGIRAAGPAGQRRP